jgi:periplasmic protein TonB
MNPTESTQAAAPKLKSGLACLCLPEARRDPERRLAWVNSLCLFFLLIGLVGVKPAASPITKLPPLAQPIPIIIEPTVAPPIRLEAQTDQKPPEQSDAPPVVAVVLPSPAIIFSVPTIGNLVVPAALAIAPPANPLAPLTVARDQPTAINSTGNGGERPNPQYPQIARDLGQQGTVLLSLTVDENGALTAVAVKESSGSPILDRSALEFVKRHWLLPAGRANRLYEAPIHYVLSN